MAGKTYSQKCGQSLQALFPCVFIRQPQIPSSVGVEGNGLEGWCQWYHGWERTAYFRVSLSPCGGLCISMASSTATDMPPGVAVQRECNLVQQHWPTRGCGKWWSDSLATEDLTVAWVCVAAGLRRRFAIQTCPGAPALSKQQYWKVFTCRVLSGDFGS